MKKFIILLFLVSNCLNLNSKCVKLFAYSKNDNVSHDIEVMKKYLILTVTAGNGHNSAAKAVKEGLEKNAEAY